MVTQTGMFTIDGKTAQITFSSPHGYSAGETFIAADGTSSEYMGPFNILVPFKVDFMPPPELNS
jgi:hypothetical protein